jgi:DnaJ family protein C protein 27
MEETCVALAVRAPSSFNALVAQIPKPLFTRIKVISMGEESVGKSCLIKRYCEERFVAKYIATIGIDYGVKRCVVDGRECRVNFWDMAGGGEYLDIRSEFYRDAQGAMLVYDVTNPRSFALLEQWVKESQKYGAKDLVTVVCANKVDLGRRVVSEAEGRRWATSKGFGYFETSASTGQNVQAMFEQLFNDVVMLMKV